MTFLTQLLNHYHLTNEDLRARNAQGSFRRLALPDGEKRFEAVLDRLEQAIAQKEKTVLYGDYDVDGLTSTAILKRALDARGLNPGFFIPSRYVEGYGLHPGRIDQFFQKGYRLIVCLDNGITAFDAIKKARGLGMEVVVIDHHSLADTLPDTPYIFHHRLSGFIDYDCSAASLSYLLSRRLLKRDDGYLAFLAGLAVLSDVMPLQGNNLELLKLALQAYNRERFGNIALILPPVATYDDLSFRLIPALNSVGRIKTDSMATNRACQFLVRMEDGTFVEKMARYILDCNAERKTTVREMKEIPSRSLSTEGGCCLSIDAPSGLCGLYANKVLRERDVSVCCFARDEKDPERLVGSIRAVDGFSAIDFLRRKEKGLVAYGGHDRACGVTILARQFFQFATDFLSECEKCRLEGVRRKDDRIDIALEDLTEGNFETLRLFEPFGEGFERPTFALSCPLEDVQRMGKYFQAVSEDRKGKAICFQDPSKAIRDGYETAVFVGSLSLDEFKGRKTYTLIANKFEEE